MILLLLSIAIAFEPAEPTAPADLPQPWGIEVNAPVLPRIWVPVDANLSVRPASADDPGALPAMADGRPLPSPWARRSRSMRSDGTVAQTTPTREHPVTGEELVRRRPQIGVRITLVSLGAVLVYAAGAGVAAGAGQAVQP